jgi:hypothetical protein
VLLVIFPERACADEHHDLIGMAVLLSQLGSSAASELCNGFQQVV